MTKFRFHLASILALAPLPVLAAAPAGYPAAEAQVLDLATKSIAIRSVRGENNRTIDVANLYKQALIAGGWAATDIEITPVDDTAYIIATWQGSDPKLKPLVISGHMDVVEAKPADWQRDPFTPVVEDGVLYGRGATDMKFNGAVALSSLIELRRSGFKPRRSIVIEFSGDEETVMKTTGLLSEKLKNAELVINADAGGGKLDEETGKPIYWSWDGAEKTYGDFKLEVTNPGGHSSAPRPENAIVQLAQALVKVGAYKFPAEQNALTKGYFAQAAAFEPDPKIAAAMRAFAANIADENAIAVLRANPATVGKVGTTCVPTMADAGHALNALPQRAAAFINCRIFPGHTLVEIQNELARVIAMPEVKIIDVTEGSFETDASPMRADFVTASTKAIRKAWGKDIAVVPSQSSGASDSMYFRRLGIPAYGASPLFTKDSEEFSHGLNERVRLENIRPGVTYYLSLLTDLAK
ncbi:M20/M25/M40 family metallo-hydrolase [Novosphingobium sp.]|uniref:M20/M25/M40 family metallo-hydrolase n=1 Tax=Novosphingobium sp. TaxID=1874826 RepID=UPI00261AB2F6|nr:M20/M25/M40 family metallo-hydrolase [Novosphingobium sp.]